MAAIGEHWTNIWENGKQPENKPEMGKMSWREYRKLLEEKEDMKRNTEDQKRRILQKKIKEKQHLDEDKRRIILDKVRIGDKKTTGANISPSLHLSLKKKSSIKGKSTDHPINSRLKQAKKDNQLDLLGKKANYYNVANEKGPSNTKYTPINEEKKENRFNKRTKLPPFTSRPHKPELPSIAKDKSVNFHRESRRTRPLVGDKPIVSLQESPRDREHNQFIEREEAKERKYGHIPAKVYDYSDSERYRTNLRDTLNKHSPRLYPVQGINTKRPKKQFRSDKQRESVESPASFSKQYDDIRSTYHLSEELPVLDHDYHEIEATAFEKPQRLKIKPKLFSKSQSHMINYNYNEINRENNQDAKKLIRSTHSTENREEYDMTPSKIRGNGGDDPIAPRRKRLPEIRTQNAIPNVKKSSHPSMKTPDLSKYHLPESGRQANYSVSRQKFRHYREMDVTSNTKIPRFTDPDSWNKIAGSVQYRKMGNSVLGSSNSISTIPLEESQLSSRSSKINDPISIINKRGNINYSQPEASTPRDMRITTTQALQKNQYGRQTSQNRNSLNDIKTQTVPNDEASYQDHKSWPIYKFQRGDKIACLIRVPHSTFDYVKQGLQLIDAIPKEVATKLPPLPQREFDTDEKVVLSPMLLLWDHPNIPLYTLQGPIYLYMPVNTSVHNDVLQQMTFLYTVDFLQWHFGDSRMVHMPVDGDEFDFMEILINDPFHQMVFDIKARYIEDTHYVDTDGLEIRSTMEPDVRIAVGSRSFDTLATIKIRPLDMNETDLRGLIPTQNAVHAVAVSPVLKVTSSEATKRPLTVYVPKPGHTLFGSVKLGLRCKLSDIRGAKVTLYIKDKKVSKYQAGTCLNREFANEYGFTLRIWKPWTGCYCFLVLEGLEPGPDNLLTGSMMEDLGLSDVEGFLTMDFLKRLSLDMETNEGKVRSLGKLLVNASTTDEIIRNSERLSLVCLKLLKRWRNSNSRKGEGPLVRRLVLCLQESGLQRESSYVQDRYSSYVTKGEANRLLAVFEELKRCPSVLVNWRSLGAELGLSGQDLHVIQRQHGDVVRRCGAMLLLGCEQLRQEFSFHRDIFLAYTKGLRLVGCRNIAGSIEHRHLPKFYVFIT